MSQCNAIGDAAIVPNGALGCLTIRPEQRSAPTTARAELSDDVCHEHALVAGRIRSRGAPQPFVAALPLVVALDADDPLDQLLELLVRKALAHGLPLGGEPAVETVAHRSHMLDDHLGERR